MSKGFPKRLTSGTPIYKTKQHPELPCPYMYIKKEKILSQSSDLVSLPSTPNLQLYIKLCWWKGQIQGHGMSSGIHPSSSICIIKATSNETLESIFHAKLIVGPNSNIIKAKGKPSHDRFNAISGRFLFRSLKMSFPEVTHSVLIRLIRSKLQISNIYPKNFGNFIRILMRNPISNQMMVLLPWWKALRRLVGKNKKKIKRESEGAGNVGHIDFIGIGLGLLASREREGNSGFHLFPSFVTVLFLRPLQGDLGLNLKVPDIFFETWKEFVSWQVASSIGCFHSKKCLTADSSSLEIFFWFPLLIAPSFLFYFNDQHSVCNACFF
ncbi:hypothetical protein E2542_SST15539 [Spatholobus suberectus]|nr:hypothetical protein E2542_SST15539 [Spatholobus suberectus]